MNIILFKIVLAWDQAPKGEKIVERSQPRSSLGRGKVAAALSPSPGRRCARFARRYFSYLTAFFAFFLHCGAWFQAKIVHTNYGIFIIAGCW